VRCAPPRGVLFPRLRDGSLYRTLIFQSRRNPVTEEQLNELDKRFEEYRHDPDKVVTWEEAKGKDLFRWALMEVVLLLSLKVLRFRVNPLNLWSSHLPGRK
jgi:hypothetical protein